MRLFFAVLPNQSVKQVFCHIIDQLKQCSKYGNFTRIDHLHLTLLFLGQVSTPKKAIQAMNQIKTQMFSLEFNTLGKFKRDAGDIWWAGVECNALLHELHHQLAAALQSKGVSLENRPYKPHLTLGREVLLDDAQMLPVFPKIRMDVTEFHLMKSERINGNLVYTSIASRKLEPF